MNARLRRSVLFGWCLALAAPAQTQPARAVRETGVPFVRWHSPQEYEGSQQVWSFVQDSRGVMYAGLSNGLRQFDGTSWRPIATPHNAPVRGLAVGADGRIYAGEVGDFGYLAAGPAGDIRFASLLEFVPAADRDFQDVRKIHITPEGIYFQSLERLFLLTPDGKGWRTRVWKPQTRFRNSFFVSGTLYLTVTGQGLYRMRGGELEKLPAEGLEQSPESLVTVLLPFAAKTILLGTGDGRLQLLDEQGLNPFPAGDGLLRKLGISGAGAVLLEDGAIAAGTRGGGLLVLERDGRTRYHLDRSAGIPSDGVLSLYIDRDGSTWVGLQNGIAKVETSSPFSEFGRPAGMSAAVNSLVRFRGALYVATFAGLLYLDAATGTFRVVPGTETSGIVGLLVHGDRLLAAAGRDGLLEIRGPAAQPVSKSAFSAVMAHSRQNPRRVWLGTRAGLASIVESDSGKWIDEGLVAATPEVRTIVEPEPGVIWLGTQARGAVRVELREGSLKDPRVKSFGRADGLAGNGGVSVHAAAGRIFFTSPEGVREFDAASGRFVESAILGSVPSGGSAEEYSLVSDRSGNLWVNFGVRPVFLQRQTDGTFVADEGRLRRIGDGRVYAMAVEDDGVVWLGGLDHVYRYDSAKARNRAYELPALIRRVIAGDKQKRILFTGEGDGAGAVRTIPYEDNEVRFEYALASFEDPARNQFQSKLENFDRDWSAWTQETRRDYTNLPSGSYVFRVRARSLTGQESSEASYGLRVLPPWYQTWWAYALYALALIAAGALAARLVRGRAVARERQRSLLREAELRAETAAAEARTLQAENERNKNVQLLSEIGKEITSSLDLDTIFFRLYENVNQLADASIFAVGLYHEQRQEIEYRLAVEKGKLYPPYTIDVRNPNQFPSWCIRNRKLICINDAAAETANYIEANEEPPRPAEPGAVAEPPQSLIYLPLMVKDRVLGIITVQSYRTNAYTSYHVDLLENLASYTAIALDNGDTYLHLKAVQDQLVVQEKLASLGALTAGIAHEIKNPLNFVNNFADLSVELMEELREEVDRLKDGGEADIENMEALLDDLTGNARKINEHGKRADGIVKSMLMHSRGGAGERQMADLNAMLEENVNLSYHGMRAQDTSFNVTIERNFAPGLGNVEVIPQDLSRVFLNILNNAGYAANEKRKTAGPGYAPTLRISTANLGDSVEVRIRDNGMGIPPQVLAKIFNPFFTTKPTGQGTGLGLSISRDIVVQEHGGQLDVDTVPGEYTEFIVRLPRYWRKSG